MAGADVTQVFAQVRALRVPAAHADVGVIALGEDPAVAAGDVAHLEQRDVAATPRARRRSRCWPRAPGRPVLAEVERRPQTPLAPSAATSTSALAREPSPKVTEGRPSRRSRPRAPSCRRGTSRRRARPARRGRHRGACAASSARPARGRRARRRREGWRKAIVVTCCSTTGPIANGRRRRAAQRDAAAAGLVAREARAVRAACARPPGRADARSASPPGPRPRR